MKWLGVDYAPDQWDAFRKAASHDEHSKSGPVDVGTDGSVSFPEGSPAGAIEKPVGPTAPVPLDVVP